MKITNFAHGTTTDNEAHISSGWKDVELSSLGVEQAKNLAKLINVKDYDVVFCSDLKRSIDTAKLAFEDNVEIFQDKRLRECNYGELNGADSSIVEPMCDKNFEIPFPQGESYDDVKKRVQEFLNEIKIKYDDKYVAIVSHKAPQLSFDVIIEGKSWERALAEDWRKTRAWQPGWDYEY